MPPATNLGLLPSSGNGTGGLITPDVRVDPPSLRRSDGNCRGSGMQASEGLSAPKPVPPPLPNTAAGFGSIGSQELSPSPVSQTPMLETLGPLPPGDLGEFPGGSRAGNASSRAAAKPFSRSLKGAAMPELLCVKSSAAASLASSALACRKLQQSVRRAVTDDVTRSPVPSAMRSPNAKSTSCCVVSSMVSSLPLARQMGFDVSARSRYPPFVNEIWK
mmetsp:Transcript_39973/g.70887  ORF Transcript_39973/g.70887 Transcript_39973/m.70887 type:complete len:218 (+) Transcript_39973:149-802(+)